MVLRLEAGEALLLLLLLLRLLLLVRHPPTRGVGLPYQILIPREELHEDRVAVRLDHLAEAVDARRGVHGREGADGVAYGKVLLGLARGGLLLLADDDAGRLRRRLLLLLLGLGAGRVGTVRLEEDLVAVLVVQGLSGRGIKGGSSRICRNEGKSVRRLARQKSFCQGILHPRSPL